MSGETKIGSLRIFPLLPRFFSPLSLFLWTGSIPSHPWNDLRDPAGYPYMDTLPLFRSAQRLPVSLYVRISPDNIHSPLAAYNLSSFFHFISLPLLRRPLDAFDRVDTPSCVQITSFHPLFFLPEDSLLHESACVPSDLDLDSSRSGFHSSDFLQRRSSSFQS